MKKYKENEATRDELYAQDKVNRMGNAKPKAPAPPGPSKASDGSPAGIAGKSTAAIGGAGPSTEGPPSAMFGDEDLVIRRKRERKEEEERQKAATATAAAVEEVVEKAVDAVENKISHA
jgi:hypothetical protein